PRIRNVLLRSHPLPSNLLCLGIGGATEIAEKRWQIISRSGRTQKLQKEQLHKAQRLLKSEGGQVPQSDARPFRFAQDNARLRSPKLRKLTARALKDVQWDCSKPR